MKSIQIKYRYILLIFLMTTGLILLGIKNYLLFHTLIELFSIVTAFVLGVIAINTRKFSKNKFISYLGIMFISIAIFDLFHTLTYKGFNILATNANIPTQLWIVGSFIEATAIITSFKLAKRNFNFTKILITHLSISSVLLLMVFKGYFPDCYIEGQGLTGFKIFSEYLIIAFLLYGIYLISRTNNYFDSNIKKYLILSAVFNIFSRLTFTLYTDVYGIFNILGHIFKLLSYIFIYYTLSETLLKKPYKLLFYQLDQYNTRLKKQSDDLIKTNKKLNSQIQKKEKVEKKLRKNQLFNQAILNSLNIGLSVINNDSKIISANKSLKDFSQLYDSIDNFIGDNYLEISKEICQKDEESYLQIKSGIKKVLRKETELFSAEYPCHSNNEKRWILLNITPLKIEGGGAVIAHNDITKRRENEETLRKLNQAVEQSSSTIVITDLNGDIEYVNPKFTETTGYTRQEAIGENPRILKSGLQDDSVYQELWDNISSGKEWWGEFCNVKKNDELYWEYASISPVKNNNGEITHYIAIKEDITLRKKMEEELKKAKADAEKANQAKSSFLAQMSHEIRTPMNGIIGLTDLLLEGDLSTENKHKLKLIDTSAQLLLGIINDILDFSKIEADKMIPENKVFSLKKLLEETVSPFEYEANKKGLGLKYSLELPTDLLLKGDPGRLKQILINLIGNAIKFTERGGIYLTVKKITDDTEIHKGETITDNSFKTRLEFTVKDTGIGIPTDELDSLFDSFVQVSNNNCKNQGTGLGLAICKRLVKMMNGEISVESEEDKGSIFTFTAVFELVQGDNYSNNCHSNHLQGKYNKDNDSVEYNNEHHLTVKTPLITHTDKNNSKDTTKKIKILLAEDNPINQELTIIILKKKSWEVKVVFNGQEAIDKVKNEHYDIILMDVQMPIMDGLEACKRIKNLENKKDIPIIAMTAYAMKEDHEKFLDAGMDDYIAKPIVKEELYKKIINNIDKSKINIKTSQEETNINKSLAQKKNKIDHNLERLLQDTNNNMKLIKKLIGIFKKNYPEKLTAIKDAIQRKDGELLKRSAHNLKGSLSNFTTGYSYQLAQQLEDLGKANQIETAWSILKELSKSIEELQVVMDDFGNSSE